jgi:hypothetical protein
LISKDFPVNLFFASVSPKYDHRGDSA